MEGSRRRFFHIKYWQLSSFPFHLRNLPFDIPFHTKILVEVSHANAHARAIAFFSYIWFKYDILSLHGCKQRSVVDIMLSYQPSAPGFDLRLGSECVMQCAGTGKEMFELCIFCFKTLHYS